MLLDFSVSFDRAFGKKAKECRKSLGISQEEVVLRLAEHGVEMCQQVYARIEKGKRPVRLYELSAIVLVLNIDLLAFFEARVSEKLQTHLNTHTTASGAG